MVSQETVERFSRLFSRLGGVFASLESSFEDTSLAKLDLVALKVLAQQDQVIMSQLAERLSVALSSTTGVVDRLVAKGYVARSRSKADRRIVQVRLTKKGASLLADHDRRARLMVERVLECLDEQEQEELIRLLEKADRALSEA